MVKRCRICPLAVVVCCCVDLSLNILAPWPATKSQKRVKAAGPKCTSMSQGPHDVRDLQGATLEVPSLSSKPLQPSSHQVHSLQITKSLSLDLFLLRNILCCLLCILWLSPPGIWRWRTSPACFDPSLTGLSVLTNAISLEFEPPSFRNGSLYAYLICISKWNYE